MKYKTKILHNKWQNYKKWQKSAEGLKEEIKINNLTEFKEVYSYYNNLSIMKQKALYATDKQTRNTLIKRFVEKEKERKKRLIDIDEEDLIDPDFFYDTQKKVKENVKFRGMTTREWADLLKDDIQDYKTELQKEGKNKKEINLSISKYFFGS